MYRKKTPKNYPIYEASYSDDFSTEQYFTYRFDFLPSKHKTTTHYEPSIKDYFLLNGFKIVSTTFSNNKRAEETTNLILVNEKDHIIIKMCITDDKTNKSCTIDVVYNGNKGTIEKILDWDIIRGFEKIKKKGNISLVKSDMGHLDIEEYDLACNDVNLELNYGKSFVNIHETILKRLNTDKDKGIILLHGEPGTGKTTYIKHLTTLIKNKEVLFIPPSMAEMLSEPSIIPFLMDHRNSILIIEDAERVISDRESGGSSAGVSNILNLTDGILGDCLNIQIIGTFNMKREKIDRALLRKGRLIVEHKFDKLSIEDTNKLLGYLNKDKIVNEGMVLSDIYNIDVDIYKTEIEGEMGFKLK